MGVKTEQVIGHYRKCLTEGHIGDLKLILNWLMLHNFNSANQQKSRDFSAILSAIDKDQVEKLRTTEMLSLGHVFYPKR